MPGFRDRIRAFADSITTNVTAAVTGGGPRVAGPPPSPNGASSFHLFWEMPRTAETARLVEVSVVLEVLVPPRLPALYFWALQVDFEEEGLVWGGGHTGLQWNRRFPGNAAVNWGGYATQERGGGVLPGSEPVLPSFPGDPNTMAYGWKPGQPYRLHIYRSPDVPKAWRADVGDLETGETTVIRDLIQPGGSGRRAGAGAADSRPTEAGGGHLRQAIVWSEVFADCDAPSVAVRWSALSATTEEGIVVRPEAVRVNYQSHQDGGCGNTSVRRDEVGLLQVTNTAREIGQGARLDLRAD
jgi:hypothetical protein